METAATLYQKYVTEGYDEKGVLNRFDIHCPENFNFAYDVIDRIAELEPHRARHGLDGRAWRGAHVHFCRFFRSIKPCSQYAVCKRNPQG